jgi:hypothetical protein
MCEGIERIQGVYDVVGDLVVTHGERYALGKVASDSVIISIEPRCMQVLSYQLSLYKYALSEDVPVRLENTDDALVRLVEDIEERDLLLKRLVEMSGRS